MNTKNSTVDAYLKALASREPVPGGGGVCALSGAMAAGLFSMVCALTRGKKRYAQAESRILAIGERMEGLRETFLRLADEDAEAFAPLSAAYRLPEDSEEERHRKKSLMEELLLGAAGVPLQVLETAHDMLEDADFLAQNGSRLVVSDVGVGVALLCASMEGALYNISVNTRLMEDKRAGEALDKKAARLLRDGKAYMELIREKVERELR